MSYFTGHPPRKMTDAEVEAMFATMQANAASDAALEPGTINPRHVPTPQEETPQPEPEQ